MRLQRAAIALANAQQPDLFVLTGDYVCYGQGYLGDLEQLLAGLSAPAVAVLGNHDHLSGAHAVRRVLAASGVTVLDNSCTVVSIHGQPLQIIGLDDAYTGHADLAKARSLLRPGLPTIGLSHIAEEANAMWEAGIPLVFSGHTHAGQITLARFNEMLINKVAGRRYIHGLYGSRMQGEGTGAVYVGAGIGSGWVPLRLGERAKREVAIFELGIFPGTFAEHHVEQRPLRGRPPSPQRTERLAAKAARHAARVERRMQRRRLRSSDMNSIAVKP